MVGTAETSNFDEFKGKDGLVENQRSTQAVFRI